MKKEKETPAPPSQTPAPLQEGVDYYLEHGRYVFTAQYLKKRGYCCGNGCRHCPYKSTSAR